MMVMHLCVCVWGGGGGVNSMFIVLMGVLGLISMLLLGGGGGGGVVFIKCAACCHTVAPRVNFSEEIIKYFELELELILLQKLEIISGFQLLTVNHWA